MRAIANHQYGTPDVLHPIEAPRPEAGPRQVLVEVRGSVVTQGDRRLRAADFPGLLGPLGRLMVGLRAPRNPVGGTMFSGRVVAIGAEVTRFAVGDDVFGSVDHGAWADLLVVDEGGAIAPKPTALDHGEAASLPYGGGTALTFLRDMAKVQPGERVLIVGATGGVGRMAVQIAGFLGASVTAVAGAEGDLARELGADEVIDYRTEDFTTRDATWDVIFDTTEGDHFRAFRGSLSDRGRYLSLYVTPRVLWEMLVTRFTPGPRALCGVALGSAASTEELCRLADQGALRPVVAARYPLEDLAQAHHRLETGIHGSVVVDVKTTAAAPVALVA